MYHILSTQKKSLYSSLFLPVQWFKFSGFHDKNVFSCLFILLRMRAHNIVQEKQNSYNERVKMWMLASRLGLNLQELGRIKKDA